MRTGERARAGRLTRGRLAYAEMRLIVSQLVWSFGLVLWSERAGPLVG